MSRWSHVGGVLAGSLLVVVSTAAGCGGNSGGSQFNTGPMAMGMFGGDDDGGGALGGGSTGGGTPYGGTVGAMCPTGAQCDVTCSGTTTTTISGTVHDPAGKNPLYGISVYVPGGPLQPLPAGVPTGSDACSCAALFKSGAVVSTTTDVNGKFTLQNAPVGSNIPLVIQVGKWRHVTSVNTTSCQDTAMTGTSVDLNGTVAAGSQDSMPDIAVSTGDADTLECLMKRIGLADTEYVAGPATGGHVHVFSGGQPGGGGGGGGGVGGAETNPMAGAPESDTNLWDSVDHLMAYDILLLSCEGGETYKANPGNLEQYLNAGGRAFASHYHYAWFSNNLSSNQGYAAPADWGANLAAWTPSGGTNAGPEDGTIVQTLNVGGGTFAKGQALDQWLGVVNALGHDGAPAGELGIFAPRYNAKVSATNTPSQPWITDSVAGGGGGGTGGGGCFGRRCDAGTGGGGGTTTDWTMYFSFDTPVDATATTDGGTPNYCGRAVFSDLHVSGCNGMGSCGDQVPYASANDSPNNMGGMAPPQGCTAGDLSPQEEVLEFMLFDLSSCVVSDRVVPPTMVPIVN